VQQVAETCELRVGGRVGRKLRNARRSRGDAIMVLGYREFHLCSTGSGGSTEPTVGYLDYRDRDASVTSDKNIREVSILRLG